MLPVVINHLLPTIDLVGGPADDNQVYREQLTAHDEPPSVRDTRKKVSGATKRYALIAIRSVKKRLTGLTKSSTTRGIL